MKRTNNGFTLLESLIVLSVVASMLLISCTIKPHYQQMAQWEPAFKSQWHQARLTAQQTQKKVTVTFDRDVVIFDRDSFKYPKGYSNNVLTQIKILKTGYVAPVTIVLTIGKHTIKIIFSLGGGEYRVEKT
ncbi:prepilin-type N-terminal cleavage/methylation domain-containing protein [Leuconostoc gelidum subsp. aenigmaticum]|uniref:prepilin-type N-terminal cleavage/methylation domain-containing protein n=1 Tax=Leuconostoc gelidum TaxID=1244 RepID=UPI001CC51EFC|nr:prepilin-type N-terminal cleavage/methylation domain-containing protein [Leuconostoc gelidum]MBZ6004109.1 prepilin-type N-terminal cleavage/methylation domain-containing protein [Leuconostoc gelidum subsp. aenigmaticum]